MATESSPTLTSTTSHTLTAPTGGIDGNRDAVAMAQTLLESLHPDRRHQFLQPSAMLPAASLRMVKDTLEGFAGQVGDEQQQRAKVAGGGGGSGRKRKRGSGRSGEPILKARRVHVGGFETGQVWEQARRMIDGVLAFAERTLGEMEENGEVAAGAPVTADGLLAEEPGAEEEAGVGGYLPDGVREVDGNDESNSDGSEDLGNADDEQEEEEEEEEEEVVEEEDNLADGAEGIQGAMAADLDDEEQQDESESAKEESAADGSVQDFIEDPHGLNDGFFSIDDFNRQSRWFEEQDARGDPNTDHANDEEEIDWSADPLSQPKKTAPSAKQSLPRHKILSGRRGKIGTIEEEGGDEGEDGDDGPTFGDMDLDAPEGQSEDDFAADGEGAEEEDVGVDGFNANEIYYKDFFAPPARKTKGNKHRKSVRFEPQHVDETDVERAISDVRRDLFDDESDRDDEDEGADALSDASAGDPKSRRSAHERRQAKLIEEIRRLEAASVAKREWTLSGEAAAADRPVNSLLEEDLDFEHVGKPVPVITPEVTESIEDLVKRRILAQEFDEVLRRRPNADTGSSSVPTRRGLEEELDDSKPDKGLAELYEEEHMRKSNPDSYVSQADEKLQLEEKAVEAMWKDVSAKLDALSSWHYKPKPAAPSLSVVADVATVTMEDAQPAVAQGVASSGSGDNSSRLAPQEIYNATGGIGTRGDGFAAAPGEVVSRGGLPAAREEMTREDKARRRRRLKERARKAGGATGTATRAVAGAHLGGSRAKQRSDTLADLKRGGVKVINRRGEITDVLGKKAKSAKTATGGRYKL